MCAFCALLLFASCSKQDQPEPGPVDTYVKGADVSWLPAMEKSIKFKNADGKEQDCLLTLKENGVNSIRLRTWVNPSSDKINGGCDLNTTVQMAKRAQDLGMKILVDLHYSDTWADPSYQKIPAAWYSHDFKTLLTDVENYTAQVLDALIASGVTPAWIQIGNEIKSGILYNSPDGSSVSKENGKIVNNDFTNCAKILNAGAKVVRAKSPTTKIIIHVENGHDKASCEWFYNGITAKNVDFDIIGLSYYPYWINNKSPLVYKDNLEQVKSNVKAWREKYSKEVFIVETGGHDQDINGSYNFLSELINSMRNISETTGVFYWEPESNREWTKGYQLGAWQSNGMPTKVIEAFNN